MMNIEQEISNLEVGERDLRRKYDLEERLIEFVVLIVKISESINTSPAGRHLAGQMVRSGCSPALQYGEAQSAESRNDFIHKLKILLKELRETSVALKIVQRIPVTERTDLVEQALKECNELIAIFVKSVDTAKKNNIPKKH